MLVSAIMSRVSDSVSPDTCLMDAADKMRTLGVYCLPVKTGSRLIGMISDGDIARRAVADGRNPATTEVAAVMSKGAAYCFADQDTDDAIRVMKGKRTRRLVVLDREDHTVGTLALGDFSLPATEALPLEETIAAFDEYYGWSRGRW